MRISTGQYFANSSNSYAKNFADTAKTQEQISSGTRLQTASDDPVGAAKVLKLQQQSAMLTQYSNNMSTITSSLTSEESILSSITDALQRARELTLSAGNGGMSDADRTSIANELGEIEESIYGMLNTKDANGNYIFAGSKSSTQPYVRNSDGTYSYQGDQTQLSLQVSDTLSLALNDTGFSIFESATNISRTQATLTAPAVNDDRITVSAGQMTSSNSYNSKFTSGEPYTLTFLSSTEFTVTDAAGNDVTAETSTNGTIDPKDDNGTTISLRGVEFEVNVTLQDTDDAADADTLIAGHEFSLASKPDTVTVNRTPSNPSTAQVTSGVVSNAGDYAAAFPDGGAVIKFTSATDYALYAAPMTDSSKPITTGTLTGTSITAAGVTFEISGTPAAGDQFSVGASSHQTQNVLNTISGLRQALQVPITDAQSSLDLKNAIASALGNLDQASQQIDITRGSIGARGNALDIQLTENSSMTLANQSTISSIADTDYATASIQLTLQQTMLQAAQLSFAKISQLSLFDKI
ncbi:MULTISPECIES: flagellar hook-associated protein 3 [unclassified Pseudomonas]|uniref:flagellar hook-associated protein 3 n=1 Tax=unclassified Pseudomonas TaxID=196821 RepID=UPI0021BB7412|nr:MULTISPECIES: flagellar hook-associated protein 3 [unclassified Pseudomonas]MCT8166362.1 flagellar hook-associated protein 3 [Pseudomonas sp. HD6422]MCT8185204.1 flagellar hook-associated protein 3 [Pseudomonas sp. HD6421]